jgi:hypothetical protein
MKTKTIARAISAKLVDEDIRDYAYHLYCQNGCQPGHELDNWLEAEACLSAGISKIRSHARLQEHTKRGSITGASASTASSELHSLAV